MANVLFSFNQYRETFIIANDIHYLSWNLLVFFLLIFSSLSSFSFKFDKSSNELVLNFSTIMLIIFHKLAGLILIQEHK